MARPNERAQMSKKDDGGPAFPLTGDAVSSENRQFVMQGMSLRDYFAKGAMESLMIGAFGDAYMTPDVLAEEAYQWADAMIRARAK